MKAKRRHSPAAVHDVTTLRFVPGIASVLLLAACVSERATERKGVAAVAPSSTVVPAAEPAPVQARPPSAPPAGFSIREGPVLDEFFPETAQVLVDGRVLVAGRVYPSLLTSFAILDRDARAWRLVRRPGPPAWANPIGFVAMDRTFAIVPQAFIGPNPSHRGGLLWNAKDETWSETGALDPSNRDELSDATATVLTDGRVLVAGGAFTSKHGGPTSESRVWSKDKGTFELVGSLATPRVGHTATLLVDGRVLVVGGQGPGAIRTAEKFDPRTGVWTPAGDLGTARHGHTATLLGDGHVLVAGGGGGRELTAEIESWDPRSNTWSVVTRMAEARTHHSATLLPDGRVVFIGGLAGAVDRIRSDSGSTRITNGDGAVTAETWDPKAGRWDPIVHPPASRYDHVTAVLPDGRLLVIGGRLGILAKKPERTEIWKRSATSDDRPLVVGLAPARLSGPTVAIDGKRVFAFGGEEIWDLESNTVAPMSRAKLLVRATHLASLGGGELLAIDGKQAARFVGGRWTDVTPPKRMYGATHALFNNADDTTVTSIDADRVLFVGGQGKDLGADVWSRTDERFTDAGRLVHPRTRHTATLLDDGRLLVTGGLGEAPLSSPMPMTAPRGPVLRAAEIWDSKRNAFVVAGAMNAARFDHAAVRLADGRVIVTGGQNGGPLTSVEAWSPKTSSWTTLAPMKAARAAHTATLLADGRVLVIGGDLESAPSTAEIYDPVKGSWTTAGVLPELWTGHQAHLLRDGRVLVTTGKRSLVLSLASTTP